MFWQFGRSWNIPQKLSEINIFIKILLSGPKLSVLEKYLTSFEYVLVNNTFTERVETALLLPKLGVNVEESKEKDTIYVKSNAE